MKKTDKPEKPGVTITNKQTGASIHIKGAKPKPAGNPEDLIRTPGKLLPRTPLMELAKFLSQKSYQQEMGDITNVSCKLKKSVWSIVGSAEPDKVEEGMIVGPEQPDLEIDKKPAKKPRAAKKEVK